MRCVPLFDGGRYPTFSGGFRYAPRFSATDFRLRSTPAQPARTVPRDVLTSQKRPFPALVREFTIRVVSQRSRVPRLCAFLPSSWVIHNNSNIPTRERSHRTCVHVVLCVARSGLFKKIIFVFYIYVILRFFRRNNTISFGLRARIVPGVVTFDGGESDPSVSGAAARSPPPPTGDLSNLKSCGRPRDRTRGDPYSVSSPPTGNRTHAQSAMARDLRTGPRVLAPSPLSLSPSKVFINWAVARSSVQSIVNRTSYSTVWR